jgi:tellurite resistance protein
MAGRADLEDKSTQELLAMAEVMYLVAVADGRFSIEERAAFLEHIESLSAGRLGARQLGPLVESWERRSGPGGFVAAEDDARLREIGQLLGDETARRIAYGLAMEIADADGEFLESEAQLLSRIAKAFDLNATDEREIAHSVRMSEVPRARGTEPPRSS